MLRPITKATFLGTSTSCALIAQKAITISQEPEAGPVHIDIPVSVAEGIATKTLTLGPIPTPAIMPVKDDAFNRPRRRLKMHVAR